MLDRVPALPAAGVVGAIGYALLTSGIFATKAELATVQETMRAEQASGYVSKQEYREDVAEMKAILKDINRDVEELKIDSAKVSK